MRVRVTPCGFGWVGPFWGGEPGVNEPHCCDEPEGHWGRHCCGCGETYANEGTA